MSCTPVVKDINWRENAMGVVIQIFNKTYGRNPEPAEVENIRLDFHTFLKEYFLHDEDPFDVWSGIQNVFESLDRRQDWDYVIISDYWLKSTEFILNSCGIHSSRMKLLTAEDGKSPRDVIRDYGKKHRLRGDEVVYLMAREIDEVVGSSAVNRLERIKPPHKKKADLLEYPRFSKLFGSAKVV